MRSISQDAAGRPPREGRACEDATSGQTFGSTVGAESLAALRGKPAADVLHLAALIRDAADTSRPRYDVLDVYVTKQRGR
jgi:hypothetical protein